MKKLIYILGFFLFAGNVQAQETADSLFQLRVDVVYLASDLLEGREPGTQGEYLAAQYISQRFEEIGLKPKGVDNSWFQPFSFKFNSNPHASEDQKSERSGKNVLGYIDNGASHTVIIGAHYDHLGYGKFGSRYFGEPAIHNGADDNASGIAVMLDLAYKLKSAPLKHNNYLFLAFSAEEWGLVGSKHFVNHPLLALDKVSYMLNLDMVGRLNEEKVLVVNGVGTSPVWKKTLESVKMGDLKIKTGESGIGPSDHTSFYLKDIPVVHFFTGQHMDYHKPIDDAPLLNYEGMAQISSYIYALMDSLDSPEKLPFTTTKDESQSRTAASFKVSLGVMPDYVSEEEGMRIDAVIEGRVAEKSGLEDGDVVIQIGAYEVGDIYAYMEALSKFEKGDQTTIKVIREGKELEFKVTF